MFYLKVFVFLHVTKLKYTREGRIRNEFGLKTGDCSGGFACAEEHISNTNILCETCFMMRRTYT